jgi:hypothetical protein
VTVIQLGPLRELCPHGVALGPTHRCIGCMDEALTNSLGLYDKATRSLEEAGSLIRSLTDENALLASENSRLLGEHMLLTNRVRELHSKLVRATEIQQKVPDVLRKMKLRIAELEGLEKAAVAQGAKAEEEVARLKKVLEERESRYQAAMNRAQEKQDREREEREEKAVKTSEEDLF